MAADCSRASPSRARKSIFYRRQQQKIPRANRKGGGVGRRTPPRQQRSGEMTIDLSRREFCIGTALIGLQAASSRAFARSEDGTVKLGLVAPMSGPNARYGAFSMRGAEMAAKEINAAGGVGGRKINVLSADSQ